MAFSDQLEFPRGLFWTAALTNSPQDVGEASKPLRVKGFVASGGAAAEILIFRTSDGATEYFRVGLPAATTIVVPIPFFVGAGGLEVLTASAAGDVGLAIFYVSLGGE